MWLDLKGISFYFNRHSSPEHEALVNFDNISLDSGDFDCTTNSLHISLSSIRSPYTRYLKLDRNLSGCDFLGIYLGRSFAFFIGQRDEKKRKLEEQYRQHSNDLANLVFEKWLDPSEDLYNSALFINACEHLNSGYHDLWDTWFGEKGYQQLSSMCDQLLENLRRQIKDKIEDEIATGFSYAFQDNQLAILVSDIYDHIWHKVENGRDLFRFEIESKDSQFFIITRQNNMNGYYRDFHYLITSSKSKLGKIKLILDSILANDQLADMVREWRLTAIERNSKLEKFRLGLRYILNIARYGFKGIDGTCSGKYGCKDWKP